MLAAVEGDVCSPSPVDDHHVAREGDGHRRARNGRGDDGVSGRCCGEGHGGAGGSSGGLEEEGPGLVEHGRHPVDGRELDLVARCDHRVLHLGDVEGAVLFAHPHQGTALDAFDPELAVGAHDTLA